MDKFFNRILITIGFLITLQTTAILAAKQHPCGKDIKTTNAFTEKNSQLYFSKETIAAYVQGNMFFPQMNFSINFHFADQYIRDPNMQWTALWTAKMEEKGYVSIGNAMTNNHLKFNIPYYSRRSKRIQEIPSSWKEITDEDLYELTQHFSFHSVRLISRYFSVGFQEKEEEKLNLTNQAVYNQDFRIEMKDFLYGQDNLEETCKLVRLLIDIKKAFRSKDLRCKNEEYQEELVLRKPKHTWTEIEKEAATKKRTKKIEEVSQTIFSNLPKGKYTWEEFYRLWRAIPRSPINTKLPIPQ